LPTAWRLRDGTAGLQPTCVVTSRSFMDGVIARLRRLGCRASDAAIP
jgi:hypothetical protein